MTTQPEQILEDNLVKQLAGMGYDKVKNGPANESKNGKRVSQKTKNENGKRVSQ